VLVDWDGDGDLDILTGSMYDYFLLLENQGTRTKHVFAKPRILQQGGNPLKTVWRTRPVVRDLDGDGRNDLLALDHDGRLVLYRGSPQGLKPGERISDQRDFSIKLDGEGRETGRANITVMDWDADGKLDVIVGNAVENFDGLRWYRNIGTQQKWILERQPNIPLNLPWNHYNLVEPVDWDKDGKIDLIAGSEGGWIYFYRQQ
jgi:hypothetical protein